MDAIPRRVRWTLAGTVGVLFAGIALGEGPADGAAGGPGDAKPALPAGKADAESGLTVAEARARGRLMHDIYAATLDAMHHRFFRVDRAVLPARAMEDVFAAMDRQSNIKAAWISVNTKAMSVDHEPKSEFEKQAARAIAAGKTEFELVDKGVYRRAGAIPLGAGCVNCHSGMFGKSPPAGRLAGLVISIPLTEK